MTPIEKRIAIALEVGFSPDTIAARMDYELALQQHQNGEIGVDEYYKRHLRLDPIPAEIPDFLTDRNAMYEAEDCLDDKTQEYAMALLLLTRDNTGRSSRSDLDRTYDCVHATAAQCADAFLIAIGKLTQ